MTKADKMAVGLLRPVNPYACILLGIFTFVWGLWLTLPFNTFGRATSLYSKMEIFAPEWAWGSWAMLVGVITVVTIMYKKKRWLARAHAFSAWHWATVSAMMWWGDWQNTGPVTYTFIAVYSAFLYLNIKVNNINFGEDIPSLTQE